MIRLKPIDDTFVTHPWQLGITENDTALKLATLNSVNVDSELNNDDLRIMWALKHPYNYRPFSAAITYKTFSKIVKISSLNL